MRNPLSTSVVEVTELSRPGVFGHGGLAGGRVACPLRGGRRCGSGCAGWRPVSLAVGGVDGLVVADAFVQAVPEDFEPAVAELAQRGVVIVAGGYLLVGELPRPRRPLQAAERPLLDGLAERAVIGQAAGDGELAAARPPGDRRAACVAFEGGRGAGLPEVLADLARAPGGETISQA